MSDSKHPLYNTWRKMKDRCLNTKAPNYDKYGGRGIKVSIEFLVFKDWLKYVSTLDNFLKPTYTLDRIRNNEDYKVGNIRWATKLEQNVNQRKRKDNTSGYTGVCFNKRDNKWNAQISVNKIRKSLGYFATKEEALKARNEYIINNKLPHKIQN